LRDAVRLCRFAFQDDRPRIGVLNERGVLDLTGAGITSLSQVLDAADPVQTVGRAAQENLPALPVESVAFLAPVEHQEIWAAGVTYLRSKTARMEESDFSATAYDRVYDAERPELFFKALAPKVIGPGQPVGIRADAKWSVPEPELALVINAHLNVVGCTIGNDMSSRDIEGENLLYLPQAKVYDRSCALGPCILLAPSEPEARTWPIRSLIKRNGQSIFAGETLVGNIKRPFDELAVYPLRSQRFPDGAVLLTGTGIVPPDDFTLQPGDEVEIEIPAIGILRNPVMVV
jgi:2-dehydro-3-deoxy-D-arabinonate dehydratase